MPVWEFKSGDNESNALNRVRKEVWAFFERKKKEEAAKKKKAKKQWQPATEDSVEVDDDNEDEVEEWFEIDPKDCPELWFCAELFTFKMFCSDPLLQHISGSEESSGPEETDIKLVTRKVNSRRQQHQMLLTKSLEKKQQEKEMHETAAKVAFAYKEKKEDWKWVALENATAFQEEKMLFEWGKLGFESGNATIKKEAQLLATNIMKSKRKAYENSLIEYYHFSDSESK